MIIGYDFWGDYTYPLWEDIDGDNIVDTVTNDITDNEGIAFDSCLPLASVDKFTLRNGCFDEFHITKDSQEINESIEKTQWSINTVLLALFQDNLIAGSMGVDGYSITEIILKKRKKGEEFWQNYFTVEYSEENDIYTVIDKFIENEAEYEYCLCPVAVDDNGNKIYGNNTTTKEVYISYDNAHIFDNSASYTLIYNLQFGNITNHIGVNVIETLSSQFPYVVYGQTNYAQGSMECLLVSEESATGSVDVKSEKQLRNNIMSFLTNKDYKILKNSDGLYMLVKIIGTPTLIPTNTIIGMYQLSFEYVQVGEANNLSDLHKANLEYTYTEACYDNDDSNSQSQEIIIKNTKTNIVGE